MGPCKPRFTEAWPESSVDEASITICCHRSASQRPKQTHVNTEKSDVQVGPARMETQRASREMISFNPYF